MGQSAFPASPSPSRRGQGYGPSLSRLRHPAGERATGTRGGRAPRAGPGRTPPLGWHVLARAPQHAMAQSGLQMLPKPATGPGNGGVKRGGVSTFPLPGGAQTPSIPWPGGCQDPPGPRHSSVQPRSRPSPSPGTRRPPAGAGQRCRWVCRPAPGSPRSSKPAALSKGWSSKIFSRAPSVYHTVNLGFQQLYDAAGRWERTKTLLCFVRHSLRVPVPPALGLEGTGPQPGL